MSVFAAVNMKPVLEDASITFCFVHEMLLLKVLQSVAVHHAVFATSNSSSINKHKLKSITHICFYNLWHHLANGKLVIMSNKLSTLQHDAEPK